VGIYLSALAFGIVEAAVLAIGTVGFTMQFAVADLLNLTYGGVMIAGAYMAYALNSSGVSVWVGLVLAGVGCGVLSVALNQLVFRPFRRRGSSHITVVIVSLGLALVVEYAIQALAGADNVSYKMHQGASLGIGAFQITVVQLVIILLSVAVMGSMHALLQYTKFGKAMRATAANQGLARNCGIRTDRVVTLTWFITGVLCGISGTVFAINTGSFGATSADLFFVVILAAMILGGPGQPYGAMVGAIIIGIITQESAALLNPSYKDVIAFVVLVAMLAYRPKGLFGAELQS
jgi:branched-chain amino acid transport system permease protein/neutral amino acid transport system permease protein